MELGRRVVNNTTEYRGKDFGGKWPGFKSN